MIRPCFRFAGATPEAFLDPDIPDDHKIILKQSYRVPRAVHTVAEGLIRQVTRRQAKEYLARPEDGELHRLSRGGYKSAEYGILKTAMEHLERGQTVMFLASCSYMLRPLVAVLRKQGIPFHNPYRKSNGFWNPIRIGKPGATACRILALMSGHPDFGEDHRPWTHGDLAAWAELLHAKGILRHGVKAKLKTYEPAQRVSFERLDEIFEPDTLESLMRAWDCGYRDLLEWWRTRVTADVSERVKFPSDVTATRGPRALLETPKVVVGTIHSVKGRPIRRRVSLPRYQPGGGRAIRSWRPCARFRDPTFLRRAHQGARNALCLPAGNRDGGDDMRPACRSDAGACGPVGVGR